MGLWLTPHALDPEPVTLNSQIQTSNPNPQGFSPFPQRLLSQQCKQRARACRGSQRASGRFGRRVWHFALSSKSRPLCRAPGKLPRTRPSVLVGKFVCVHAARGGTRCQDRYNIHSFRRRRAVVCDNGMCARAIDDDVDPGYAYLYGGVRV